MTIINIRNVLPHFSSISVALPVQPDFWKSGQPGTPYEKSSCFRGSNQKLRWQKKNCGSGMHIRNTFCKKKWVKTAIPALSSGQSNLQTPIWGCHRQLDDQYRNPNMNKKDHLVGQLTSHAGKGRVQKPQSR